MCNKNFITGLFFLLITTADSYGQPTLPPAAQEAINKGLMATKIPDYLLAVRYFEDARKAAPQSPEVFFNLGLAESKIPGRELRAICWFSAYLTANPAAPNAAAVKEQMDMLMIKNQSNLNGLIKSVQDAAMQTSSPDMEHIAWLWAKVGDINTALKAADIYKGDPILMDLRKSRAFQGIAKIQTDNDDFEGAKKTTELIVSEDNKSQALINIAEAQIKAGDIAGAKITLAASVKAAQLIEKYWVTYKINTLNDIAIVQLRTMDTSGARSTLLMAQKEADLTEPSTSTYYMKYIATGLLLAGDTLTARNILTTAQKNAESDEKMFMRFNILYDIAVLQSKAGDMSGFKKTLTSALKAAVDATDQSHIAIAQAETGDISGAIETTKKIQTKDKTQEYIGWIVLVGKAKIQLKSGDIEGTLKTLALALKVGDIMEEGDRKSHVYREVTEVYIEIAKIQLKAGDIEGTLKTLALALKVGDIMEEGDEKSHVYREVTEVYIEIEKLQIKAGDIEAVKKTLELTQKAAELIKGDDSKDLIEWHIADIQLDIIKELIKSNDNASVQKILVSVMKTIDLMPESWSKAYYLGLVVNYLVKINDFAAAQKTVGLITEAELKTSAQKTIAVAHAQAGDITGAQTIVDLIQDTLYKFFTEIDIAEIQIKDGDIPGAKKTILIAQNYAHLIKDSSAKSNAMTAIAGAQIKAGDITGSTSTLLFAKDLADHISDSFKKSIAFLWIAEVQIKTGDLIQAKASISSAKKAAESIQDLDRRIGAQTTIAETQVKAGDMAEAKKTFIEAQKVTELAEDTASVSRLWEIVEKSLQKADITGITRPTPKTALPKMAAKPASDKQQEKILGWIKKLDDKSAYEGALNTDIFLDITSYLKSIPAADPNKYFDGLKNAADTIVAAQNMIEKMMKEIK